MQLNAIQQTQHFETKFVTYLVKLFINNKQSFMD